MLRYIITYKHQFSLKIYLRLSLSILKGRKFPRSLLVASHYDACLFVRCVASSNICFGYPIIIFYYIINPMRMFSFENVYILKCLQPQDSCYYIEYVITIVYTVYLFKASLSILLTASIPTPYLGSVIMTHVYSFAA